MARRTALVRRLRRPAGDRRHAQPRRRSGHRPSPEPARGPVDSQFRPGGPAGLAPVDPLRRIGGRGRRDAPVRHAGAAGRRQPRRAAAVLVLGGAPDRLPADPAAAGLERAAAGRGPHHHRLRSVPDSLSVRPVVRASAGAGAGQRRPPGGGGGARGGRAGGPGQERLPGDHEPRGAHADERRARRRRAPSPDAAGRVPGRICRDDLQRRRGADERAQRRARPQQDRGRQVPDRPGADRPSRPGAPLRRPVDPAGRGRRPDLRCPHRLLDARRQCWSTRAG